MPTDPRIEACARAAHEVNRAYCIAMGDVSQTSWEDAPDWQKESARTGVVGALAGATAEKSHEGWLADKVAAGWTYGAVKNPWKKEHPCMVAYEKLPPAQRHKDFLFVATVRSLAASLGMTVSYPPHPDGTPGRTIDWSTTVPGGA